MMRALQEQDNPLERVGRGFRDQVTGDRGLGIIGLTVLGVILFAVILWAVTRRDRGEGRRIFRRLADANGLNRAERRLLAAVAERSGEENAASLFFRRGLFEDAVADMTPDREVVEAVRRKVYGP